MTASDTCSICQGDGIARIDFDYEAVICQCSQPFLADLLPALEPVQDP